MRVRLHCNDFFSQVLVLFSVYCARVQGRTIVSFFASLSIVLVCRDVFELRTRARLRCNGIFWFPSVVISQFGLHMRTVMFCCCCCCCLFYNVRHVLTSCEPVWLTNTSWDLETPFGQCFSVKYIANNKYILIFTIYWETKICSPLWIESLQGTRIFWTRIVSSCMKWEKQQTNYLLIIYRDNSRPSFLNVVQTEYLFCRIYATDLRNNLFNIKSIPLKGH